jgi:hypothetical protein
LGKTNNRKRKWTVKGFKRYLSFYRYTDEYVEVVRVIHAARDIPSTFRITANSDRRPTPAMQKGDRRIE